MLCEPAQYLLRIDDLCPAVSAYGWRACAELVAEFGLRPILAVVPENRDPGLEQSPADPGFWAQMREMQAAGATVALHGYRHICASEGRSILRLAARSEFAGIDFATQCAWIDSGLRILRGHGLDPRVWVAPRHGFDRNTLRALKAGGIATLSDGLARMPFVRAGMTWIPQQLWAPVERASGLWTIAIHPNTMRDADLAALRSFVRKHALRFTSVDRVLAEFPPRRLSVGEYAYARFALGRLRVRKWRARRP